MIENELKITIYIIHQDEREKFRLFIKCSIECIMLQNQYGLNFIEKLKAPKQQQPMKWQSTKKEHFITAHFHFVDSITWKCMKVKQFTYGMYVRSHQICDSTFDWNTFSYISVDRFNLMQIILYREFRVLCMAIFYSLFRMYIYFRFHSFHTHTPHTFRASIQARNHHCSLSIFRLLCCGGSFFKKNLYDIFKKRKGISNCIPTFRHTHTHAHHTYHFIKYLSY